MNQYLNFDDVYDLHVEPSNRCNAACPMCARNYFGGALAEGLILDEWSKNDIEKIFTKKFINLQNVMMCGTHGDPCVTKELLYAVEYIKKIYDKITIEIYTNGSLQNKDYWNNLGKILKEKVDKNRWHDRKNDLVIFSIDGLKDTNHLYRRRTNFEKIMDNANEYIKAGGIARWDFIVFKHNQHQVDDAKEIAKKMGFKQFRIRKTSRFVYSPEGLDKWPVLDKDQNLEYYLEPPTIKEYKNFENLDEPIKKHGSFENYVNNTPINCLYKNKFRRYYINAYAQVFPCCYIGNDIYPGYGKILEDTSKKVLQKYDKNFNSLRHKTWEEILSHDWFKKDLVQSWDSSINEKKLLRCGRTCGQEFKPITSQSFDTRFW